MLLFSSGLKLSNGSIYANFVAQSKLASSGFCRNFWQLVLHMVTKSTREADCFRVDTFEIALAS